MAKLVQEYFSESAKKFPQKLAVDVSHEDKSNFREGSLSMSFGDLEKYSNKFARYLKEKGVKRGDRVAFMFMKIASVDAIASLLAILRSDSIYVPLHHALPPERVAKIWNDARPKFIICESYSAKELKKYEKGEFQFIEIDKERMYVEKQSDEPLVYENSGEDSAYILYTSGSTGTPKGVEITHNNIINATDWAVEEFGINDQDRMSQHPPFSFDLSTFDLYCAFKSGATLYPVPDNLSLFPWGLLKFIEETQITIWNSVPSVLVYLWNSGLVKPDRLGSVNKIFFNGEGFPTKFLAEWRKTFPKKEFINMYGPTETTVQCSFYKVLTPPTDLSRLVPIGKAQRGAEIFIVREDNSIAGVGEVGELLVGGLGVGKGYWNNEERTKVAFVEYPGRGRVYRTGDLARLLPDGNYEFIGRKDNQVKIHGNRIELGDVESTALSFPKVKEAGARVVRDSDTGTDELAIWLNAEEGYTVQEFISDCSVALPSYMIPKEVYIQNHPLLRTTTGKIDRNQLRYDE